MYKSVESSIGIHDLYIYIYIYIYHLHLSSTKLYVYLFPQIPSLSHDVQNDSPVWFCSRPVRKRYPDKILNMYIYMLHYRNYFIILFYWFTVKLYKYMLFHNFILYANACVRYTRGFGVSFLYLDW